jgi:hypothetical protein
LDQKGVQPVESSPVVWPPYQSLDCNPISCMCSSTVTTKKSCK